MRDRDGPREHAAADRDRPLGVIPATHVALSAEDEQRAVDALANLLVPMIASRLESDDVGCGNP